MTNYNIRFTDKDGATWDMHFESRAAFLSYVGQKALIIANYEFI